MKISISDFSKERDVDRDTVNAWIRKHPEVEVDCSYSGKDKIIDTNSNGFAILEKKYPLPKPIEVIEDTESRAKLIKTLEALDQLRTKSHEVINELKDKLEAQNTLIAQAEATKLLLEDKEEQLEKAENRLEKAEKRAEQLDEDIRLLRSEKELKDQEIKKLQAQLQDEKSKTLWQRIWNK